MEEHTLYFNIFLLFPWDQLRPWGWLEKGTTTCRSRQLRKLELQLPEPAKPNSHRTVSTHSFPVSAMKNFCCWDRDKEIEQETVTVAVGIGFCSSQLVTHGLAMQSIIVQGPQLQYVWPSKMDTSPAKVSWFSPWKVGLSSTELVVLWFASLKYLHIICISHSIYPSIYLFISSYLILSYLILSYLTRIISYHIISCPITSYHVLSYLISLVPYLILSCPVLSHLTWSYPILSF